MEINNRPSPFVLVKTGSGIFSPGVPQTGLKIPHFRINTKDFLA